MKRLIIHPERCVACESCTLACSFYHHKDFNRSKSRIDVTIFWKEGKGVPTTCNQCAEAPCIEVCHVGALTRNKDDVVVLNYDLCIGCMLCVSVCPFGAMIILPDTHYPIKCDLCDGDPQCVRICGVQALEYKDVSEIGANKRKETAKKICDPLEEATKKHLRDYGKKSPWSVPGYEEFEPIP